MEAVALKRPGRRWSLPRGVAIHILVWVMAGLVINGAQYWLFKSSILGLLPMLVHFVWGLVLVAVWLFKARWLALGAMLVVMAAMWRLSGDIGFMVARPMFDEIVEDVKAGRIVLDEASAYGEQVSADGVEFRFTKDRPGVLVFPWIMGIPDGGWAYAYDPSDSLSKVKAGTISDDDPIVGLVIGHPVDCVRVTDPHYYKCIFW